MNGLLVIVSSPSGGGKTTVVNELVKQLSDDAARLVTSTTRPPRATEKDGIDYHFLTRSEFVYKIIEGGFLEHITYAGNLYGIDKKMLKKMLKRHRYVLAPIDVRGAASLRAMPVRQISFFLAPENREVLEKRLRNRPNMTPDELADRLAYAEHEIAEAREFDYTVVNRNGKFGETIADIRGRLTEKR